MGAARRSSNYFNVNALTPDGKWLVLRSNMWGPGDVCAVEVANAAP